MKKLIFVKTGKEVEVGKQIVFYIQSAYGKIPIHYVIINEESLPYLIEEGVIKEVEEEGTHVDPNFYLEHLAGRIHWNVDNLRKYLGNLYTIYPAAVFSILLKEIALVLDEKYNNYIENSKEIYSISSLNGEVTKVKDLNKIKNFKNFAVFRTLDDALAAKHILKGLSDVLFKSNGK